MTSVVALMLHSLQTIGPIVKNVSDCVKIIFPYLKAKKEELCYPKELYSLIVTDTLKGQDNAKIKALRLTNDCELVSASHNLTNKFQSVDIYTNQKAKKFIFHKLNT